MNESGIKDPSRLPGNAESNRAKTHRYIQGTPQPDRVITAVVVLGLALGFSRPLWGGQGGVQSQLDRLDWQPTWAREGAQYVGRGACAECHANVGVAQEASAMAHALAAPAQSLVLQSHPRLTFTQGPYSYTIVRSGDGVSYEVTNGRDTISVPIAWAFGQGVGEVGQTYLLSYHGSYYEGRVTFYNGIQGLDITLGHSAATPVSLEGALGRILQPEELRACFGCHSTGAVREGRLQLDKAVPGITCEGCHGPGAQHLAAMKSGESRATHIFNPATLKTGDLVKFCGACHRTAAHVEAIHAHGVATVRFQPYRLSESRCFNPADRRIGCLACHNPHQNPQRESTSYDGKCLACHNTRKEAPLPSKTSAPACPVARSRCVTCHMPKYALAGSHFKFTDHRIRVVRLGDNFD